MSTNTKWAALLEASNEELRAGMAADERGELTEERRAEILTRADTLSDLFLDQIDDPEHRAILEYMNAVGDKFVLIAKRIRALEAALANGGERGSFGDLANGDGPVLRWRGAWDEAIEYRAGECVVHNDALWVCETGSRSVRPSTGGPKSSWRIMLKTPDLRGSARDRR